MIDRIKKYIYGNYWILFRFKSQKMYRHGRTKSLIRIFLDQYIWFLREGSPNRMYFAYGLNVRGTSVYDYIGKKSFLKIKSRAERALAVKAGSIGFDYSVTLKDKFNATSVLSANNIPCIENIFIISNGFIIKRDLSICTLDELLKLPSPFVLKNALTEASEGVYYAQTGGNKMFLGNSLLDIDQLRTMVGRSRWVVQPVVTPGKEIMKINGSALNITRITTVNDGNSLHYLRGFQSFATQNSRLDSWGGGAVYVGLDVANECLKKEGFCHPQVGMSGIITQHPDSGIVFEGYKLSFLKEAVNLCIKAHYLFPQIFCIGWDVVLTDNGPKILEGNEIPGLDAVQCIEGGLRRELVKYSWITSKPV